MLVNILDEQGLAIVDTICDRSQPVISGERDHSHIFVFKHVFKPLIGLFLWIDTETPTFGLGGQDTVLKRHSV